MSNVKRQYGGAFKGKVGLAALRGDMHWVVHWDPSGHCWMGDGTELDLADLEQDRHLAPKTQILGHLPRLKTNGDLALARLITLQQKQLVFDLSP